MSMDTPKDKSVPEENTLLPPTEVKRERADELPVHKVNLLSFVTYAWLDGFMYRAFRRGVTDADIWACPREDSAEHNAKVMGRLWDEEVRVRGGESRASLLRVSMRFCRQRFAVAVVLIGLAFTLLTIIQTYIFLKILTWMRVDGGELWMGVSLTFALLASQTVFPWLFISSLTVSTFAAVRLRAAIMFLVYKKVLGRAAADPRASAGQFVNLFANDSTRIVDGMVFLQMLPGYLFLMTGSGAYSYVLLRHWSLVGFFIVLLLIPIQLMAGKTLMKLRRKALPQTDRRVKMMKETLENIKSVKMFAWERHFTGTISDVRRSEQRYIERANIGMSLTMMSSTLFVALATMSTVVLCSVFGRNFTYVEIFAYVLLYSTVTSIFDFTMVCVKHFSEFRVAILRCQQILREKSCEAAEVAKEINESTDENFPLVFDHVTFAWSGSEVSSECLSVALQDIDLKVKKGDTVGVVGPVGSGKSAFISAVLGQLHTVEGTFSKTGLIAYIPQQPWVFNASLRDNILFYSPFNKERYNNVLEACCLTHDLNILPDGDLTEIGERGVNLSGGQKHRVNIARALYSDRDIVLMDDPFSALDPDIADQMFENVVRDMLQKKTVILVTHQLQYLPKCDYIVHLEHGKMKQHGTHQQLMDTDPQYKQYVNSKNLEENNTKGAVEKTTSPQDNNSTAIKSSSAEPAAVLVTSERGSSGAVSRATFWAYASAAGGPLAVTAALAVCVLAEATRSFSFWWLGVWLAATGGGEADDTEMAYYNASSISPSNTTGLYVDIHGAHPHRRYYILIYASSLLGIFLFFGLRSVVIMKIMGRASTVLHQKLFAKVLASPMSLFDTTSLGQIINRFSKDQDEVDTYMPVEIDNLLKFLTRTSMFLVLIGAIIHWFFLIAPISVTIFCGTYLLFRAGIRDVRRLYNISCSPLLALVGSTIHGLPLIRAYGRTEELKLRFTELFDYNTSRLAVYYCIKWWNGIRLNLINAVNIFVTALIIVVLKDMDHVRLEFAGVVFVYAAQFAGIMQQMVSMAVESEARFTSVERINDYIKNLPSEKHSVSPEDEADNSKWPKTGKVEFVEYDMRYREGLPLSLHGVSVSVDDHDKVAVVGRTGAGKSSLTSALFRLCEAAGGKILIDGVDISTLSLEQLRSNISIIPQEPILFSGTIRTNVDPLSHHTDERIWQSLEKCHIKSKILSLDGKLDASVSEGGKNLSVGERQLLCLARVLLKETKILILDEATASVDSRISQKLQQCLHEAFEFCTMLVIAHRLDTILSCEKILVVEDGKVVEFDHTEKLTADKNSHFYKLMLSGSSGGVVSGQSENED